MRRAKHPPTPEQCALASVVLDALVENRTDDVFDDLKALLPVACGEYLRRYPKTRKASDRDLFVVVYNATAGEKDLCCFFCRESLNTLPWRQSIPGKMIRGFNDHARICAMRMLAGQITGVGPQGEIWSPPRPPKQREKKCGACDGDGHFVVGGECTYCNGKGRVAA